MTYISNSELELMPLKESDVKGLIELSASVGWDYDADEIGTVLSTGTIFGHKTAEGKIVSSAAIIPYASKVASIGMVIVHQEYRGKGLAKGVTQTCIDTTAIDTTIMLIATEEGKPLYEGMGFQSVDRVDKFLCESFQPTSNNCEATIENFTPLDLNDIIRLDHSAFGDNRSRFLVNRINQSEKCLVARNGKGDAIGYGMSISGPINRIIGPIVAPDAQIAACLVNQIAARDRVRLRIDVPSGNESFTLFLKKSGFHQVSQPPIMVLNSTQMPTRNRTLFGIAAQIFG
jgi:predicted N-acetyltransferase YhbS